MKDAVMDVAAGKQRALAMYSGVFPLWTVDNA
jgi:hypothetical protein